MAQSSGIVDNIDCKNPQRMSCYDTDDEAPVMCPFITITRLGVVAPERVLSMGQIELNYVLMVN